MNSAKARVQSRASIRFRDIKAGAESIVRLVRGRIMLRMLVRFLPVVVMAVWSISPAQANGVNSPISSGQIVSGTVTGTNNDTYTFPVSAGDTVFVSGSAVGTPTSDIRIDTYNASVRTKPIPLALITFTPGLRRPPAGHGR